MKISKKWISSTGLVVGSIVPDFEFFIRMEAFSLYSHTIKGIFLFNLPLGLLLCFLFHGIVRDELINNLPDFLRDRLSSFKKFNWMDYFKKHWVIVVVSIIIGIASHLFLDAFTHYDGFFVTKYAWLAANLHIASFEIPMYQVLQYATSLLGAILILYFIIKLPSIQTPETSKITTRKKYWLTMFAIATVVIGIDVLSGREYNMQEHLRVIVVCISAALIGLLVTSFAFRKWV